jgi:Uma2 family endonuclease
VPRHKELRQPLDFSAELDGPAVILEERLRVPAAVHTLASFRKWAHSDRFPEHGRIDYLDGDVEIDLSPEDLYTHGVVKTAMAAVLHALVAEEDRGHVFVDRTRVTSPEAGLSAEPDIVVILWESLAAGRVRHVPSKEPGHYREIEGAPDLIVEIVSDSSVRKDTERLPRLYALAGVPEIWRVDARREDLRFQIFVLEAGAYRALEPDSEGWLLSPCLGRRFRPPLDLALSARPHHRLTIPANLFLAPFV